MALDFTNGWVDTEKPIISISKVLEMIQTPFNQEEVAQKTYNKRFNDPTSEYYQMTVEQIMSKWKAKGAESLRYGKLNDEYIGIVLEGSETDKELFVINNDPISDERLAKQIESFDSYIDYIKDKEHYLCREQTVYLDMGDFYVKGRFDALFESTINGDLIIKDWKTSGTVDTTANQWTGNLLGPAKIFPALNHYVYTTQLYFYKYAILKHYGGSNYEHINVKIVNFPGKPFDDGKLFKEYDSAYPFDTEYLDKVFEFAYKKNLILNKKK